MFGWEFPPHISGGLGTACEGLTRALAKEDVTLTFVVPKLFGGEENGPFTLVSASEVPLNRKLLPSDKHVTVSREVTSTRKVYKTVIDEDGLERSEQNGASIAKNHRRRFKVLQVQSPLLPYSHPDHSKHNYTLEEWQMEWKKSAVFAARKKVRTISRDERIFVDNEVKEFYTHQFSGSYGPDLLGETLRYAEVAAEIAVKHQHEIIHAHDWISYPAGLAAKRVSGKPLIVHVHATEIDRSGNRSNPVVFDIEKKGLEGADHVVAVSEWTKQILTKHYDIPGEKISVVHNGIIIEDKPPVQSPIRLGSHIVTFLGRITYQKGPMHFVQAATKVLKRFPDAHFVVAGSGDLLGPMIELVAQSRVSSHFHFTGFLKGCDIDRIWGMTDVYVMPSVSEPFGITPLEAIRAGVPVIVSNQSGVSEVLNHAIKVDFWRTDELAEAICAILSYPTLSKILNEYSKEELQEITWEKASQKIVKIYDHQLKI
jgi:glycogen synthase